MELMLTGDVGLPPLDQETIRAALAAQDGTPLKVTMNSGGGDAFVGEAIRAMLVGKQVTCTIAGMCASAAVTIAMGCSKILMTANSAMMIHRTSVGVYGNADELASRLNLLETLDAGLVALYTARTGKSEKVVRAWLEAETWFTAAEALEAGLIDEVLPAIEVAASVTKAVVPAHIQAALDAPVRVVQAIHMSFLDTIKAKLGLAKDAPEETVLAAVEAAVAEPVKAAPPGMTVEDVARIVGEQLAAQRQAAEASAVDVVAQAHTAAATSAVERFITAGKIAPAGRDAAIAACGNSVQALNACVAYWESAAPVVGAPIKVGTVESKVSPLSAFELRLVKESGITAEQYLASKGLSK